ncbi:MAG: hypothetical protein HYW50_02385 [Candidatus Diapherotrites archaeon]|nr:hypothetical protein [Candidatus Diapherotrites archaeon]
MTANIPRRRIKKIWVTTEYLTNPKSALRKREILHRYSKAGTKPPSFSLQVTQAVKDFARSFPKTEEGVRQMISRIQSMVVLVREKPSVADFHYMLQSTHDIISKRKIPVPFKRNQAEYGCNSLCIAIAGCLKAQNIPFVFVRTIAYWEAGDIGESHSVVVFRLGKKLFVTDPFRKIGATRQIGEKLHTQIEDLKRKGKWIEGKSPEDLGIFSIEDFNKHNKKTLA